MVAQELPVTVAQPRVVDLAGAAIAAARNNQFRVLALAWIPTATCVRRELPAKARELIDSSPYTPPFFAAL